MKEFRFWQVDAFTSTPFSGNPAAVFILQEAIDDSLMLNISTEMNLSETAFVLLRPGHNPYLRWFTPMYEIDLCGHATLATSLVYFTEVDKNADEVTFDTKFVGPLRVTKKDSLITMDFPSREGKELELTCIPQFVLESLSAVKPRLAFQSRDLLLVYDDEKTVLDMKPNFTALLDYKDFIIVTAPSTNPKYDFISRFFCGAEGILEDPVTGSAHCTLAPYWSKQLKKKKMLAYQASKRGGVLYLDLQGDRLAISGEAVVVIDGSMKV